MKSKSMILVLTVMTCLLLGACENTTHTSSEDVGGAFDIKNLTDEEYPDNPDIGFRASDYQFEYFDRGQVLEEENRFTFEFFAAEDTIILEEISLAEYIPTIPQHLREDEYLSKLALVNQEWNRNQVRFEGEEFEATNAAVVRVDLARNCLNAYLWEIIVYIREDGKEVPFAHGWFDFPKELYHELFQEKNKVDFAKYESVLVDWVDPANKEVDRDLLRTVVDTLGIQYSDESDAMYPIAKARKKKFKEIIYPDTFETMRDLQSDSTLFATFSPPGYYNKEDPRKTELGRLYQLQNVRGYRIRTNNGQEGLYEIELTYTDQSKKRTTSLVLGGLDLDNLPKLPPSEANSGWKSSMGFGNHPFYETYQEHIACKMAANPYYAYFTDENHKWLDSHRIGVDGPLMHWDAEGKLDLWLLSFERHALVGHYVLEIQGVQ